MTAHATLSPSAAHRWFECPGSIRMSVGVPNKSSVHADEGTAAHTLIEKCLTADKPAGDYLGEILEVRGGRQFEVTLEMVDAVQIFLDHVNHYVGLGYELSVEVRLDLSHLWPDQFGTGDAILYHPDTRDLHVCDFKYGVGVAVEVQENPQLLTYGSGAAKRYHNRGVEHLTLHVVQPRTPGDPVKSWTTTVQRLREFETEFREAAERTAQPDAPLKPGDWCRWCPAAGTCPALRDRAMRLAQAEFDVMDRLKALPAPEQMTADELGHLLTEVSLIETWCARVREHAFAVAQEGTMPTGFKLVSKRAVRKWADETQAASALKLVYDLDDVDIYTRKIVSPAQAEKLIGKRDAKALSSLVSKVSSGVTLAPLSDKREAVKVDASTEFGGDE